MSDWHPTDHAAAALVGLLADEGRKPPRVLARKIADHLDALGLLASPSELGDDDDEPEGQLVLMGQRPEPPTWLRFAATLDDEDEAPVAVTRNRTEKAMRHLGLDPSQVRAVVVEHDFLRVFRWSDRTAAQTMPILEEPA